MKKIYIAPVIEVISLNTTEILAGSNSYTLGNTTDTTTDQTGGIEIADGGESLSKGNTCYNIWE